MCGVLPGVDGYDIVILFFNIYDRGSFHMSDGPHRSLTVSKRWKQVAKRMSFVTQCI